MVNNCVFVGRLAKDPECRTTQSGVKYALFSIAVERSYAAEGRERETDFIDCRAWRNTAEFIGKYFHKGSWIGVEGEIQTSNYEAEDGSKRKSVFCLVNKASFVGPAARDQQQEAIRSTDPNVPDGFKSLEEDIPF